MAPLSWQKSKDLLAQANKDRTVATFLAHIDQIKVDHKLTAESYGCKASGMKNLYNSALRKLRDNGCYLEEGEDPTLIKTREVTQKKRKLDSAAGGGVGRVFKVNKVEQVRSKRHKAEAEAETSDASEHQTEREGKQSESDEE
ncbi:hypothetical protein EJ08DRAFT_700670 [Tothia fuscella]|uniref:Uncharacterized protein n=1 Tax=Tothia fuscella TaxID=1048955 RepID=A0A9P4NK46_9PEZI|nr:hypothetical protein EJ08DRAFT_700670 [Tothia fuscella]